MIALVSGVRLVLGSLGAGAVVAALAWAAVEVRAVAVPGWRGARARLAEVVVALALGLLLARLVGAAQQLRPLPVAAVLVVVPVLVAQAAQFGA